MSDARRAYPADRSDAEWATLAPLLPPASPCDRPRKWPERLIADAVSYVLRSGGAWCMLPREFPPWPTVYARFRVRAVPCTRGSVYARFRRWRVSGTLRSARVRVTEGRAPEASAGVIDGRSAKTAGVGGPERGYDGAKRLKGRKRHPRTGGHLGTGAASARASGRAARPGWSPTARRDGGA